MARPAPEQRHPRTARLSRWALVLLVLLVYGQTLTFDFINLDDNQYVTENPHVLGGLSPNSVRWAFTPTGYAANWHPLVWLSLMLDVELYGQWPGGFHLTNVLLHALNTLVLFSLLARFTGETSRSFLVAALFAVHPLHVESVAWVSERKDVLSTLFGLCALAAYGRYVQRMRLSSYLTAWFCLLLSLMSKQMLVTLPCLLLLLDVWPLGRLPGRPQLQPGSTLLAAWRRLIAEKLPFVALSAVFCAVAIWAQQTGGALYTWDRISLGTRLSNAVVTCVIYLRQTVWPAGLAVFYPYPAVGPGWIEVAGSIALLVGMTLLSTRRSYLLTGWLWFLITLLPVIGIVQVGEQAHADRYMYFPQIGLFIAATWWIADRFEARLHRPRMTRLLAAAVLLLFTALGWKQTSYWRDSVTLFRRTLEVTDENALAHGTLAAALMNNPEQLGEAERHLRESLRIRPENATAHFNLGLILSDHGDLSQANAHFRQALALKPDYQRPRLLLCVNLKRLGEVEELRRHLSQLNTRPESWPAALKPALDFLQSP